MSLAKYLHLCLCNYFNDRPYLEQIGDIIMRLIYISFLTIWTDMK